MFDVDRLLERIKKVVPINDISTLLEKLSDDSTFKVLKNAGTIGSIFNIVLQITNNVYTAITPVNKRLSIILLRIMLESAKNSLPYSIINTRVTEILHQQGKDFAKDFEDIVLDLFKFIDQINVDKNNNKDNENIDSPYLYDQPVFIRFRELLVEEIKIINRKHGYNIIDPAEFTLEFNSNFIIKLEEEREKDYNNKDLKNLLHKWKVNIEFNKLKFYLTNARKVYFEKNPIDEKSLSEYYVDIKSYMVSKDTWNNIEEYIIKEEEKEEKEWNLDLFLKNSSNHIEVIAAPFGIGKSSIARKISYDCANKFIVNPASPYAYVPIFVRLKSSLQITCNGNASLENDLLGITNVHQKKECKHTCDIGWLG